MRNNNHVIIQFDITFVSICGGLVCDPVEPFRVNSSKSFTSNLNFILLFSLFFSHLLSGISNQLIIGLVLWKPEFNHLILILDIFRHFTIPCEMTFTISLSIERQFAIQRPFLYQKMTKKHFLGVVFSSMLIPVLFVILHYLAGDTGIEFAFYTSTVALVVIVQSNVVMYLSVRRQCRFMTSTIVSHSQERRTVEQYRIKKRRQKSLKICFLIAATFLLLWYPMAVYKYVRIRQGRYEQSGYIDRIPEVFAFSNAIWDVVVFGCYNKNFRNTLLRSLSCIRQKIQRKNTVASVTATETVAWFLMKRTKIMSVPNIYKI